MAPIPARDRRASRPLCIATQCAAMHSFDRGFHGGDELGQVPVGDPAQLADLDAAELAGAEQVVHLVPADVQHFRYLLDCVCLHFAWPLLRCCWLWVAGHVRLIRAVAGAGALIGWGRAAWAM